VSRRFAGSDRQHVVGEVDNQVQPPTERLDVAGDGFNGGGLTALDLRYPLRSDAHAFAS
jgi:hypothetical protein